jgi:outer membrane protein assembly factor BamB
MHRLHRLIRLLVIPVALIGLLAAAGPAQAGPGDWWQFGYTAAGTRFNLNETAIGATNVARLVVGAEQVPTFGAGATFAHASGVAVAGGRAYVQVGNFESGTSALLAYDTGAFQSPPLWQQRSGCSNASPTVHLSIVFVGATACRPSGDDGGVRAFDAATGRQLWYSHELGIGNGTEDASNVAATSGAVYFSLYENAVYGGDNALLSLDARTGAVRWRATGVFGAPAVAGGRVFAGVGANLQARSASTGALLWSRPGGGFGPMPAVTGGVVYSIGLENGTWRLFARSVSDGALRWKRAVPGSGGLAVAGGRVLVATGSGLRAVDAATGALRWNVTVAAQGAPAVANGLVYAGLQQGIGAWRLSDGAQRWRYGTIAYGSPSVSGGRVYATGVRFPDTDQYAAVVDQFRLRPA